MNINRINSAEVSGIYNKSKSKPQPVNNNNIAKTDDLVLSESGQIFNQALKAVKEMPEVREAKINNIAQQIKTNSYKVSSDLIADKILKGAGFDKRV